MAQKTQKTEAQTHILVKVVCPHCQASGKVDMSRLDQSFTCGKCRKKFHVDVRQTRKGVREDKPENDPAAVTLNLDSPTLVDRILSRIHVRLSLPSGRNWIVSAVVVSGRDVAAG